MTETVKHERRLFVDRHAPGGKTHKRRAQTQANERTRSVWVGFKMRERACVRLDGARGSISLDSVDSGLVNINVD